jgi:membrane protease YdiL (CAAX protease family)
VKDVRSAVALQTAYAAAACLLLVFADIGPPPRRVGSLAAGAAGLVLAVVLYLTLARGGEAPDRRLLVPAVGAGATEEVVWRWGVLAGAAPVLGWPGALALSTWGFALRHARSDGLVAYLVLGASFGGVFLATGRLLAAIAAHAGYNALVLLACKR